MLDAKKIIDKMKAYEIEKIENRYKDLREEHITEIFDMAKNKEEIQFLEDNMDILVELVYGGVYVDKDILRTYIFINSSSDFRYNTDLQESTELTEEILENGFGLCQGYVFYIEEEKLEELAKRVLRHKLDEPEYLKKYFSKEELADLWIQNRGKEDVIEQLIFVYDIENLLELSQTVAFTTSEGDKVYYSYLDYRYI